MADEPTFPSPEAARRRNAEVKVSPSEPRAAIVVQRPEPMPGSTSPPTKGEAPKLTPDEVRALLAVSDENRPSTATTLWRRGRVIMIPTGILSLLFQLFFGDFAPYAIGLLVIGGIVWMARPLFRRDGWS